MVSAVVRVVVSAGFRPVFPAVAGASFSLRQRMPGEAGLAWGAALSRSGGRRSSVAAGPWGGPCSCRRVQSLGLCDTTCGVVRIARLAGVPQGPDSARVRRACVGTTCIGTFCLGTACLGTISTRTPCRSILCRGSHCRSSHCRGTAPVRRAPAVAPSAGGRHRGTRLVAALSFLGRSAVRPCSRCPEPGSCTCQDRPSHVLPP